MTVTEISTKMTLIFLQRTITYYADQDQDGYGDDNAGTRRSQPAGYVTDGGDCNDSSRPRR